MGVKKKEKVWFAFGDGEPQLFEFSTPAEMNSFIEGVEAAADGFDLNGYRQFDSEEEVAEFLAER